ncbi:MAG: molybdopterin-containing oxidoreductase family protein [Rudaea sp.]
MPAITRRDFLKAGAAGAAVFVLTGCGETKPRSERIQPYVNAPEDQPTGLASYYASTCRMCPAGCGIVVRIINGRAVKIEGNPDHPVNRGKLCARGQAGLQLLYNPDRLQSPQQQASRNSGQWQTLKWDDALNVFASKLQGAGSGVAVWLGSTTSGHVYDLFTKFASSIGGAAPLVFDLYSGLLGYHAQSSVQNNLFGNAALSAYDLSGADVVLSFGGNFLGASENQVRYGMDFGKFRAQAPGKRGLLVQFEPRLSATGVKADKWVAIRPGTEVLIAQALARLIADENMGAADRVSRAKSLAGQADVNQAAQAAGLSPEQLRKVARLFAEADNPLAIAGDYLTGQDKAEETLTAIHALNAIGGGKPGGLILQAPVPSGPARPAFGSWGDAKALVDKMKSGQVKALLVYGANPAYDLPPKFGFADAVKNVPFVASFASILDDTAAFADLVLPDRTYLEAWGYEVVTPNFGTPVVGSQQPVVPPFTDSRATADVLLDLAKKIPQAAGPLPWKDEVTFLKESIGKLPAGAFGGGSAEVLWSRFQQHGGWWPANPSPAPAAQIKLSAAPNAAPPAYQGSESEYPLFLHLYMQDFLSDGRGANIPWLQGAPDPMTTVSWQTCVEMHPNLAGKLGVNDGDVVKVPSPQGEIQALVYQLPTMRDDTVAISFGQGHTEYGRFARNRGSNPIALVGADTPGGNLGWRTLRVKIAKTGQNVKLARFENAEGARNGFINAEFPSK